MKKNIIFDLGLVLINWDPDLVYDAYFKDSTKTKTKQFYQETGILDLNRKMDRGLSFDAGLKALSVQFPHYAEPILFWKEKWTDMIGGVVEKSVEILEALYHAEYPLYALTNWSTETFPYVHTKYQFFDYFRDIVISGKENTIKPEPMIYEILLKRNQLQAQDCIFIDDKEENIEGAIQLGMQGVLFKTPEQLAVDLRAMGILSQE